MMLRIEKHAGGWVIVTEWGSVRRLDGHPDTPVQWRTRKALVSAISVQWGQWVDRKNRIHPNLPASYTPEAAL